jgi:hypothetical protein
MALSSSSLSGKIKAAIIAAFGVATNDAELTSFCDSVAAAIVDEIQSNASVPSGIAVTVSLATGIGATTAPGTVE